MNVILKRLNSNNKNLRTNEIIGETENLPKLNKPFVMTAESLTPGKDFRLIETSLVIGIVNTASSIRFKTQNSEYELEVINN